MESHPIRPPRHRVAPHEEREENAGEAAAPNARFQRVLPKVLFWEPHSLVHDNITDFSLGLLWGLFLLKSNNSESHAIYDVSDPVT